MECMGKADERLGEVRREINEIDSQLLPLLLKRMECSAKVARIKSEFSIPVLNKEREQEIIDKVRERAGQLGDSAAELYSAIMSVSRAYQYSILDKQGPLRELVNSAPQQAELAGKRVVCQGVEGAYSHKAARTYFGEDAFIHFAHRFSDVFEEVAGNMSDFGVVPMENSAAGSVSEVYGLLMKYKFFICGSVKVLVNHCLCAKDESPVKKVISHPQGLLQCSEYIKRLGCERMEFSNTAAAAKYVAESEEQGLAAICSREAAEKYGLLILEEGIQDSKNNYTRFAVISKNPVLPPEAQKITLCFVLPNRPGSLSDVLGRFSCSGLNLTKIESRPIKDSNFEYEFYLDFSGNIHTEKVLRLLENLSAELDSFSFLGNYTELSV